MKIGAQVIDENKCRFVVWAPLAGTVILETTSPAQKTFSMHRCPGGYWEIVADGISQGATYLYQIDGKQGRPDPASNFQPQGVHGPSQVINHNDFKWQDDLWKGIPLDKMIIYELHVAAFTPSGTFDAVIPRLGDLADLGINTVEIMPVCQFPGERNWGYDGVYPFSVQNSYAGPQGLKRLVDACHRHGFSVVLDVVYNHLGPEGNYLSQFAPYFTDRYHTPWGKALNFDGKDSDGVRNLFTQNALYWFKDYHIDGLRLDAIHGICDNSPKHILRELKENAEDFSRQRGRQAYLFAESDLNDVRVIREKENSGYGLDAVWCDDFHHSLHTLLTHEKGGYYADFGKAGHISKAFREGFVYSGEYSQYRKKPHGTASAEFQGDKFIVFSQNHDQIGNRMFGERLASLVDFQGLKLAAGAVLVSCCIPLLFMGEEYAERAPFLYFVDHSDKDLLTAIREGRRKEFGSFHLQGELPDPGSKETFLESKLNWDTRTLGEHRVMLDFYKQLISLRKSIPALSSLDKKAMEVSYIEDKKIIFLARWHQASMIYCIMGFNNQDLRCWIDVPEGRWEKAVDSCDERWLGKGASLPEIIEGKGEFTISPSSFALYRKQYSGVV